MKFTELSKIPDQHEGSFSDMRVQSSDMLPIFKNNTIRLRQRTEVVVHEL